MLEAGLGRELVVRSQPRRGRVNVLLKHLESLRAQSELGRLIGEVGNCAELNQVLVRDGATLRSILNALRGGSLLECHEGGVLVEDRLIVRRVVGELRSPER